MPRFVTHANQERSAFRGNGLRKAGLLVALWLAGSGAAMAAGAVPPLTVTTYHGDVMRTGWNAQETTLTPATVGSTAFAKLGVVTLDSQVDAQPLYLGGQAIAGGTHNVVYVATEANSIYAIDADSGSVLVTRNYGQPVRMGSLPGACVNNGPTVGITSTPVIDQAAGTLYAITYTVESGSPVYRIHALDLATLADKIPSVVVTATQKLAGGSTYRFNPAVSRQRAALLEANGAIYAAFASFCDMAADVSRGWVLGWRAATLTPLPAADLTDKQAASPFNFFITPIWMSGYGLASDELGNLLFVTGNSDPSGNTYNKYTNLSESAVKLSPDLTKVLSYFTPDAPNFDVASLDRWDDDFGSGGIMVLPQQPGTYPRLAVAAGKVGQMYLLNRDNLGGFRNDGVDHVLGTVSIGLCWCGESYFQGADGIGRVVSSGGANVVVWKVKTTGARPQLVYESASARLITGQDGGFFTTVSSNGTQANSQIIWAVSRPVDTKPSTVVLYAFNPSAYDLMGQNATLFSGVAGNWPNSGANAPIVPLVANGRVYVATYKRLAIFGLKGGPLIAASTAVPDSATPDTAAGEPDAMLPGHAIYGRLEAIGKQFLTLRTRTGVALSVDASTAESAHRSATPLVGHAFLVRGDYDRAGVLHATSILKVNDSPALWQPDN